MGRQSGPDPSVVLDSRLVMRLLNPYSAWKLTQVVQLLVSFRILVLLLLLLCRVLDWLLKASSSFLRMRTALATGTRLGSLSCDWFAAKTSGDHKLRATIFDSDRIIPTFAFFTVLGTSFACSFSLSDILAFVVEKTLVVTELTTSFLSFWARAFRRVLYEPAQDFTFILAFPFSFFGSLLFRLNLSFRGRWCFRFLKCLFGSFGKGSGSCSPGIFRVMAVAAFVAELTFARVPESEARCFSSCRVVTTFASIPVLSILTFSFTLKSTLIKGYFLAFV